MNIISLITDFGLKDNFVGVMKAVILGINPSVHIIDICHEVKPHDILEAAFLLRSSFRYFPSSTVHLVVVDPRVGSKRKKIIVKTKNYFFVGPDNGVFSLVLKDEPPSEIIEITKEKYFLKPVSDTFHGRDIFASVAAHLTKTKNIYRFGKKIKSFQYLSLPKVKITSKDLIGEVIYIDHFGNLISNIDKNTLENFIKDRQFKIFIKKKIIDKLSHSYVEGQNLKPIALISSYNCLEIAINCGSASAHLGVNKGCKIIVTRK